MHKLIVHIIDRLPPDGAERLIVETLKNRSSKYHYEVLALVEGGLLVDELEAMGVPVTILGRRNGYDHKHALALFRWLRDKKPFAIHTHLFTADAWGRTFAWLARVPGIFTTVHSTNTWKSKYHLIIDRILAQISDRVIACTEDVRKTISEQGIPERKLINIPNGVDLNRIAGTPEVNLATEFKLNADLPTFALIGRLHEAKGHSDLLFSLESLALEGYEFQCLFVGEGELEDELRENVKTRGLSDFVTFTGFRRDVIGILKNLDFIVMPSLWEGLPISLLESMACGTPAIASRVGGIPDVIEQGEDGILYEQGDNAALKDSIASLMTNKPLRESLATKGAQKVRNHYSAASVAKAYESLYDQIQ